MENKSKGKTIAIVILVLLILGLGGYMIYDKFIKEDETAELNKQIKSLNKEIDALKKDNNANSSNDKSNSIVGEYNYSKEYDNGPTVTKTIDFMEDGTYYMLNAVTTAEISYGTYNVDNNKITLNQVFIHGAEIGDGQKSKETYTYELNSDGTISGAIEDEKFILTKNNEINDVKNELMDWLIYDVEEYSKSLNS